MKILRTPVIALHLGAKQIDSQRHFRDLQTAWLRRIPLRGRVLYSHGLQFIQGAPASIILVNAKLCRIQWLCRYLCLLKSTSHTLTRSERPCPCLASPWWSASTVSGRACALSRKSAFFESCAKTKTFMYVSPSSHCPHSFFLQVAKTPASLSPLNPCDSGTPHKTAHELAKLPAVWNANHEAWRTARKSELEASFAGALVHCIALAFCVKQALFCR